ncbi:MAG: ABC transporter permease [Desulfobacteraceae bacterium]|nr:MAG: ABC transporter permease [Desulfobacteraceae bacterium]
MSQPIPEIVYPSPRQIMIRRTLTHKGFLIGAIMLLLISAAALLAPVLSPYDPYNQDLSRRMINPVWHENGSWEHPLGTDNLGRDYLSRLMYGARISLLLGGCAMLISGVIGTSLGIAAGYFGGRVDMVVGFLITARLSMPVVLVALAVVALIGSSLNVIIWVLGLLIWDRFAVVMRASTQQLREMDYVNAAKAIGCSTLRVLVSEILPNVFNNLIVVATLEIAHAILLEAALSFLGMGVQPPLPSWGLMVAEGKEFMLFSPWVIFIPGTVLSLLVLAINLMGDGIRDITAPEGRS